LRRNRLDIIADILNAAKKGLRKTRIVYSTNLNFKLANKYLPLLTENGLLEVIDRDYITTSQGIEFLENYSKIQASVISRPYNVGNHAMRAGI
jgi:predicted transcriptional regulator